MWDLASASAPALPSRPRAVRVVPEEDPWPYRLPALERSAPLAIAAIDREEIRTPEIGVQPLSIEPLEIESLER
jgi:hypothetical protein